MKIAGFYSDPHYGHANSIKYCDRPFADVEEMNEGMAARYNETIGPDDTCVWVGDCFFGKFHKGSYAVDLLARLNGRKWLTLGNHDHRGYAYYLKLGFEMVFERGFYVTMAGTPVYVNHYPASAFHPGDDQYQDRFPILKEGVVLMHGHTHEKVKVTPKGALHAGVDAWNYRPALWEEMAALVPDAQRAKLAYEAEKREAARELKNAEKEAPTT